MKLILDSNSRDLLTKAVYTTLTWCLSCCSFYSAHSSNAWSLVNILLHRTVCEFVRRMLPCCNAHPWPLVHQHEQPSLERIGKKNQAYLQAPAVLQLYGERGSSTMLTIGKIMILRGSYNLIRLKDRAMHSYFIQRYLNIAVISQRQSVKPILHQCEAVDKEKTACDRISLN